MDNPDLNQKQIQELVEKERFFLLPGKNREESDKAMCDMLMKHLDVDNSGEVTREEFVMRWNNFAQALFADHQAIDHSLECSVM